MIEKQALFEKTKKQSQTGTSVQKAKQCGLAQKRRSLSTSEDLQHNLQVQQMLNINVDTLKQELMKDFRSEMKDTFKESVGELFTAHISKLEKTNQELVASNNSVVATVNTLADQNKEFLRDMQEMKATVAQLPTDTGSNSIL